MGNAQGRTIHSNDVTWYSRKAIPFLNSGRDGFAVGLSPALPRSIAPAYVFVWPPSNRANKRICEQTKEWSKQKK